MDPVNLGCLLAGFGLILLALLVAILRDMFRDRRQHRQRL